MPARRNFRRAPRRPRFKKADKTKLMVDGKSTLTRAENMLKNGASIATTVYALAKAVGAIQKGMNAETKYTDLALSGVATSLTGVVNNITVIAQGTDDNQRIGNSIKLQKLHYRWVVHDNTSAAPHRGMIMFLVDKQYDGVDPTATEILEAVEPLSMLNQDYSKRFVVLKRHNYTLSPGNVSLQFEGHVDLPFHCKYDAAAGAVASGKENQILALNIGSSVNIINHAYIRITYTDD